MTPWAPVPAPQPRDLLGGIGRDHECVVLSLAILASAVLLTSIGIASATPGSGVVSNTILAQSVFTDRIGLTVKVNGPVASPAVTKVKAAEGVVFTNLVLAPAGYLGWHSHPGPTIVAVAAGTLTMYLADDPECTPHVYEAGEAFVEPGPGSVWFGRNEGTVNVVLYAAFLDVASSTETRIDDADPGTCPF